MASLYEGDGDESRAQIYNAILRFKKANDGCAPTTVELSELTDIPEISVRHHLGILKRERWISHIGGIGIRKGRRDIVIVSGFQRAKNLTGQDIADNRRNLEREASQQGVKKTIRRTKTPPANS